MGFEAPDEKAPSCQSLRWGDLARAWSHNCQNTIVTYRYVDIYIYTSIYIDIYTYIDRYQCSSRSDPAQQKSTEVEK